MTLQTAGIEAEQRSQADTGDDSDTYRAGLRRDLETLETIGLASCDRAFEIISELDATPERFPRMARRVHRRKDQYDALILHR